MEPRASCVPGIIAGFRVNVPQILNMDPHLKSVLIALTGVGRPALIIVDTFW